LETFLRARPDGDLHALILSSVEMVAIAAFLFDRLAKPACAALCLVFAAATVITTLKGEVPLEFLYFAATAIYIVVAQREAGARALIHPAS
jgi:hypothetical protein